MNKSELVGEVAARTGLNRMDVAGAVDAVFETVSEVLGQGEEVRIGGFGGFGQFATRSRPARTARNPRTGEPVAVEASTAPTFKPAKALRDTVNSGASS